jgi:hypothetical protein
MLHHLTATEWVFRGGRNGEDVAIIRRLEFGDRRKPDVWFRVVAESPRELIGYVRTLEDAAQLAFEYSCALESWQHTRASRLDAREPRPRAAEMAAAYRVAMQQRR